MNDDWARVGTAVRARRLAVNLTQREAAGAAGVSDTTWLVLESGRKVGERTVLGACRALNWTADSIERLLDGGDAEEVAVPPESNRLDGFERRLGALEGQVALVTAAVDRIREQLEQRTPRPAAPR